MMLKIVEEDGPSISATCICQNRVQRVLRGDHVVVEVDPDSVDLLRSQRRGVVERPVQAKPSLCVSHFDL